MTEKPTTRLFAMTISAQRTKENGEPEISMQTVVAFLPRDYDVQATSLEHARGIFPDAEGWFDHQVIWTEISREMTFGPYRLTWEAEDTRTGAKV
jgi:hypothetical protein